MWFFVLLVSAKVIVLLVLDQDKFTHEEQEQLKQDMLATRRLLEEVRPMLQTIIDNLHTEEEQTEQLRLLKSIEAAITSKS